MHLPSQTTRSRARQRGVRAQGREKDRAYDLRPTTCVRAGRGRVICSTKLHSGSTRRHGHLVGPMVATSLLAHHCALREYVRERTYESKGIVASIG
jgi:hypothetical protein